MISETYNMDCMDYMRSVPKHFFDLAIVRSEEHTSELQSR